MLLDLKTYLQKHRPASMLDLTNHYRIDADALRGMLDHWIRKGRVRRLDLDDAHAACPHMGACAACGSACFEVYEWLDRADDGNASSPDRHS